MNATRKPFSVVLVGGGPAGIAVLLSAHRDGRLKELLRQGLLLVERSPTLGKGQIGRYVINSDSTGATFVDPLRVGTEVLLHDLLKTPVAERIAAAGPDAVSLQDVGELMGLIGHTMQTIIASYPQSAVLTSCTADSAQRLADGTWQLNVTLQDGETRAIPTKNLIVATGATQPEAKLQRDVVAGAPVVARWGGKLLQSGEVLTAEGLARVARSLTHKEAPKVAILGGSTSAMAVAHALLNRLPEIRFHTRGITLFHRRPLRVYYASIPEAVSDGYTEFNSEDLCPITQRVYRLAGLRLDSRELLMQVRGIGGRLAEPRLHLHALQPEDPEALRLIDAADVVVAALGYRPNALRLQDENGEHIPLFADTFEAAPLVDRQCRVLESTGAAIPGVFGIGLAAGFVPHGRLGGEPSFSGQANGLWLWQNDIGSIIVHSVLSSMPSVARRSRPYAVASSKSPHVERERTAAR